MNIPANVATAELEEMVQRHVEEAEKVFDTFNTAGIPVCMDTVNILTVLDERHNTQHGSSISEYIPWVEFSAVNRSIQVISKMSAKIDQLFQLAHESMEMGNLSKAEDYVNLITEGMDIGTKLLEEVMAFNKKAMPLLNTEETQLICDAHDANSAVVKSFSEQK